MIYIYTNTHSQCIKTIQLVHIIKMTLQSQHGKVIIIIFKNMEKWDSEIKENMDQGKEE